MEETKSIGGRGDQ